MSLKSIPAAVALSVIFAAAPVSAHIPSSCLSLLNNLSTEWTSYTRLTAQIGGAAERLKRDLGNVGYVRELVSLVRKRGTQVNVVVNAERKLLSCIFNN